LTPISAARWPWPCWEKDAQASAAHFPDDQSAMLALNKAEVELAATLPDDFSHAVGTHLEFTRPVLWDGVGFLLPDGSKVLRARQLSGKKICFIAETAVEESVRAWFARERLDFVPFPFQEEGEMQAAFLPPATAARWAGEATRLPRRAWLLRSMDIARVYCRSVFQKTAGGGGA